MSEGLKTLLEAAQYIEQQEKLKLSPLSASAVPAALLNSDQQSRFIVHAYDAATTNGHLINNNNNSTSHSTVNHSINIRNSNIRHVGLSGGNAGTATTTTTTTLQVSSSAPAAAATFQHVNGHHPAHHHPQHQHAAASAAAAAAAIALTNSANSGNGGGNNMEEELFGLEKVYLNRLMDMLPPAMLEQLQHQHALTLTRSIMPSTFWNLPRHGLIIPYHLERHLFNLNNMLMETLTPRTLSIQPAHVSNIPPTGNLLNDVFLRLHINSQNTQLTETSGGINRTDITHMHRATAHATVAQFANYYQTLQMLKQFINIPATTTATTTSLTSCCHPENTLKTSKEYFYNSLNRLNCKTLSARNTHVTRREKRLPHKRAENFVNRSNDLNSVQNCDNADNLLPPPKKKWIRHYLTGIYENKYKRLLYLSGTVSAILIAKVLVKVK
uniref:Uncharacterized protein n=1 Tax=Glossina austeni TaxID=7395 RepID=A0A1A9VLI4_GLOAU